MFLLVLLHICIHIHNIFWFKNWYSATLYIFSLAACYCHSKLVLRLFLLTHIESVGLKMPYSFAVYESTNLYPTNKEFAYNFSYYSRSAKSLPFMSWSAFIWIPSKYRHLEVEWLGCRICTFSILLLLPNDLPKWCILYTPTNGINSHSLM